MPILQKLIIYMLLRNKLNSNILSCHSWTCHSAQGILSRTFDTNLKRNELEKLYYKIHWNHHSEFLVSNKKWHDQFLKDLKSHRCHREHTGTLLGYISKRKTFSFSQRRPLLTLGRARRSCFGQSTSRNYCLRCKKLAPNRRSSGRGRGWTRGEEGEDTTGREGGSLSYFDSWETICSELKNKENIAVNKRLKTIPNEFECCLVKLSGCLMRRNCF